MNTFIHQVRALETELHYSSLNAGDVFLLDAWNAFFLWIGQHANPPEVQARGQSREKGESWKKQSTTGSIDDKRACESDLYSRAKRRKDFWLRALGFRL